MKKRGSDKYTCINHHLCWIQIRGEVLLPLLFESFLCLQFVVSFPQLKN